MMSNELLNVMTVDELRNYASHMTDVLGCVGDLIYAKDELNESLQRCFNNSRYEAERNREYTRLLIRLGEIEENLMKEHWDELPHPTPCRCEEKTASTFPC